MTLRLVPRENPGPWTGPGVAAGALAASLLCGAALFAVAGAPPLAALGTLLAEPFGSAFGVSETLLAATPLMLCGLSVALAFRVGLWNIGAEGQLYLGAFAATGLALHAPVPAPWSLLLASMAGAIAGALWALGPALLRVRAGVSEILTTLLLNYVALAWIEYWVFGAWKGADGFPYTAYLDPAWHLPLVLQRAHLGLPVAVALAALLAWLVRHTTAGYEVRVIGASPAAARHAGLPVASRTIAVMAVAGGLAGLAGSFEITGVAHRLHASLSPGHGYTAIIVAFLAGHRLLVVPLVAVGFAALGVGGEALQIEYPALSAAAVDALQGVLLVSVLVGQGLGRYRLVRDGADAPGARARERAPEARA